MKTETEGKRGNEKKGKRERKKKKRKRERMIFCLKMAWGKKYHKGKPYPP